MITRLLLDTCSICKYGLRFLSIFLPKRRKSEMRSSFQNFIYIDGPLSNIDVYNNTDNTNIDILSSCVFSFDSIDQFARWVKEKEKRLCPLLILNKTPGPSEHTAMRSILASPEATKLQSRKNGEELDR